MRSTVELLLIVAEWWTLILIVVPKIERRPNRPGETHELPWRYRQADDLSVPVVDVARAAHYDVLAELMPPAVPPAVRRVDDGGAMYDRSAHRLHDAMLCKPATRVQTTHVQTKGGWTDRKVVRSWPPELQRELTSESPLSLNLPWSEVLAARERVQRRLASEKGGWK